MEKKTKIQDVNKRNYYNASDSGKAFLWAVITPYIIILFSIILALGAFSKAGIEPSEVLDSLGFIITSAILTPLSFFAVFMVYNKINRISFSASQISFKLHWKTVLVLIAISFVCVFGLQYFIYGIELGLEALGYNIVSTNLPLDNVGWYFLNLLLLAFLPAVCEELIFRGIIFSGLKNVLKPFEAVLFSAFLFALMHGSLQQLIYPFILGIVLGWVALRTGNVLSSIILHFCNNALVITLAFLEKVTGFSFIPTDKIAFWVLAIALLFVVAGILYIIERFFFKKEKKLESQTMIFEGSEIQNSGKLASLNMIIGIVLAGGLFIINVVSAFMN